MEVLVRIPGEVSEENRGSFSENLGGTTSGKSWKF